MFAGSYVDDDSCLTMDVCSCTPTSGCGRIFTPSTTGQSTRSAVRRLCLWITHACASFNVNCITIVGNTYEDHWADNFGNAIVDHLFAQILVPLDNPTFWFSRIFRILESLEKHSGKTQTIDPSIL